jgi:DNA primase
MTDIELIKSKIDIVSFISEYVQLKKSGHNFKARCPFHGEKTPSFYVSPERQAWYCFGACATGGDIISFLQKWDNLEFLEALKILADKAGVRLSRMEPPQSTQKKEKIFEINHLTSEFFHYLLTQHKLGKKAMDYLKERGISDKIIQTFMLGYAPLSWESTLKFLQKKGFSNQDIQNSGLIVSGNQGRFYDRFRGRLIFTLKNVHGQIIGFSGRVLPGMDEKSAKYINSPETAVYNKGSTLYGLDVTRDFIKKANSAVVVEGEFDLLSSYQAGVTNVVAIKGSAFTEQQALLIKRYTENLKLALDADFAGNEAAKRGIEILDGLGLDVRVIKLPVGKDPAECIEKGIYLWKEAVEKPIPVYDFIIESAFAKYNPKDPSGKKKISGEALGVISKINNPIIQSHYLRDLATRLDVNEDSIVSAMKKLEKGEKPQVINFTSVNKIKREEMLEEHLLALVMQSDRPNEYLEEINQRIQLSDYYSPAVRMIYENLVSYFKTREDIDLSVFSSSLSKETIPIFDKICLYDLEKLKKDPIRYKQEILYTVKEIIRLSTRRRIEQITTKIRENEKSDPQKDTDTLNIELKALLERLSLLDKENQSM